MFRLGLPSHSLFRIFAIPLGAPTLDIEMIVCLRFAVSSQ